MAAGISIVSPGALADPINLGPPDGGVRPDANPHTYCFGPSYSSAAWQQGAHDSLAMTAANTDLERLYRSSCVTSGSAQTDVVIEEFDLPGTTRGNYTCMRTHSNGRCDRSRIRIDFDEIWAQSGTAGVPGTYDTNWRKTVCHELGHSMGLTHYKVAAFPAAPDGQNSCMISGHIASTSTAFIVYSAHHKNHINANF